MRALPPKLAAEWYTSEAPESNGTVGYLLEPFRFEVYATLTQRNVMLTEDPEQTVQDGTPLKKSPEEAGRINLLGLAMDIARASLRDINGLEDWHDQDGTPLKKPREFKLVFEELPVHGGGTRQMVTADCMARLPNSLQGELLQLCQEINEVTARKRERIRFTPASSRRESPATGTKPTAPTDVQRTRKRLN